MVCSSIKLHLDWILTQFSLYEVHGEKPPKICNTFITDLITIPVILHCYYVVTRLVKEKKPCTIYLQQSGLLVA